jgi:nicotinamidase-related amidase
MPVVLTTVNVKSGKNAPIIHQLSEVFPGVDPIDRSSINAWEDQDFYNAVKATGRKKLIMGALWTEVCLAFPALDAMREGYEVFAVTDAVGGTSLDAHNAGLRRIEQAGAHPIGWVSLLCELQRDWNRTKTVPGFASLVFTVEGN